MENTTFYNQFIAELDDIESRAKRVGSSITDICREAGIARATPDRWRKKAPKSVDLIDKMRKAVNEAEERAAASI